MQSTLTLFIIPAALSPRVRHRDSSSSIGGVVSGYLSLPDRLAMHAAQNRAAGLALRLGQWVLSVVKEEQAEICPVKLKPDTALLRACISYSAKPELWEAPGEWGTEGEAAAGRRNLDGERDWQLSEHVPVVMLLSMRRLTRPHILGLIENTCFLTHDHSTPPAYLRFSNHAAHLSGGTGLSLNLCRSSGPARRTRAPGHRCPANNTGLIDQLGGINNPPKKTGPGLVRSVIDSPHASDTWNGLLGRLFEEPRPFVPQNPTLHPK